VQCPGFTGFGKGVLDGLQSLRTGLMKFIVGAKKA